MIDSQWLLWIIVVAQAAVLMILLLRDKSASPSKPIQSVKTAPSKPEKTAAAGETHATEDVEQLKEQLKLKTIELANLAKANEDKHRLILSLQAKLSALSATHPEIREDVAALTQALAGKASTDDPTFEMQMDELYQAFFKTLKAHYPLLSSQDLRICAYLKIGMNSREIADLLGIQLSSAFIVRSRLRKKLGLKPEEDLLSFLNQF